MKDMNIIKLDNVGISIDYDEKKYEKSASVSKKLNILFIGTLIILVGFVLYDMFFMLSLRENLQTISNNKMIIIQLIATFFLMIFYKIVESIINKDDIKIYSDKVYALQAYVNSDFVLMGEDKLYFFSLFNGDDFKSHAIEFPEVKSHAIKLEFPEGITRCDAKNITSIQLSINDANEIYIKDMTLEEK